MTQQRTAIDTLSAICDESLRESLAGIQPGERLKRWQQYDVKLREMLDTVSSADTPEKKRREVAEELYTLLRVGLHSPRVANHVADRYAG